MNKDLLNEGRTVARQLNRYVHMVMPSILGCGERFDLGITMFGPDWLPSPERETVTFGGSQGVGGLPESVVIEPGAEGMITISGLEATGPELAVVRGTVGGVRVESNPAWVQADPRERIFWGDIHVHTRLSNCHEWACKSPEFCYEFARDAARLDFAAAADHTRGIAAAPDRWPRLQECVSMYDAPGRFVPMLAFESSHAQGCGGDNNVYFRDARGPFFWLERDDMKGNAPKIPLEDMWRWLDERGGKYMTAPHHTGRRGKYRTFRDPTYDPSRERFFEIYSAWGSSETRWSRFPISGGQNDDESYFVDAIRHGCRYGVIASSDDHTTLTGGEGRVWRVPLGRTPLNGYHHKGLAAVRCRSLTREAVWDALWSRNCYATTFSRVPLDFRVGDVPMGKEMSVGPRDTLHTRRPVTVRFSTLSGGDVTVTVMRNGVEWRKHVRMWNQPRGPVEEVTLVDDEPLDRIAVRDARFHPAPFVTYYARIETGDAQTQWSSPAWLDLA